MPIPARTAATLLAVLFALCLATAARAEQLITQVSRDEVAITSSFQGETLTLFGEVSPDVGAEQRFVEGPYHMVITVTGPLQNRVARRKSNVFGVWLNTDEATFKAFPSFYTVLSDAHLTDITDGITLAERHIPLISQARLAANASWLDSLNFGDELVRLMEKKGAFSLNEQGVIFRSNTLFFAQVTVPSDAVPGPYLAHSYLFKDGQIVAERSDKFTVRKIGFERLLGTAAHQQPLLYGVVCVLLALFTGWLGGVVFRR